MTYRFGIPVLLWAGLLSGCDSSVDRLREEETPDGPEPGELVADYRARTLAGDSLSLLDLRGEVVLLNFWATWCKPCVAEFPDLIELRNELGPRGLRIVGVSVDSRPPEEVQTFLDRHGVDWVNVIDSEWNVDHTFGWARGVPKSMLIDANGRVVVWWWGQLDTRSARNREHFERALLKRARAPGPSQPVHRQ